MNFMMSLGWQNEKYVIKFSDCESQNYEEFHSRHFLLVSAEFLTCAKKKYQNTRLTFSVNKRIKNLSSRWTATVPIRYVKSLTDLIVVSDLVVIVPRSFDVTRSHHKQIKLKLNSKLKRLWRQKSPCRLLHGKFERKKLHNCVSMDLPIHKHEDSQNISHGEKQLFSRQFHRPHHTNQFLMRHKNKYMTELAYNILQVIIFILLLLVRLPCELCGS